MTPCFMGKGGLNLLIYSGGGHSTRDFGYGDFNVCVGGAVFGVVLGVRSRGRTYATRNLHFFAELGVRGTPKLLKVSGVDSAEAASPAAPRSLFRSRHEISHLRPIWKKTKVVKHLDMYW